MLICQSAGGGRLQFYKLMQLQKIDVLHFACVTLFGFEEYEKSDISRRNISCHVVVLLINEIINLKIIIIKGWNSIIIRNVYRE